jgi:hypothetical protein
MPGQSCEEACAVAEAAEQAVLEKCQEIAAKELEIATAQSELSTLNSEKTVLQLAFSNALADKMVACSGED